MDEQLPKEHTSAMLKEMIKSTHHLDNILQRLCDANDPKHEQPCAAESPSDSSEESDADFTDCIEASPRNMQPTSSSYFENVTNIVQAARKGHYTLVNAVGNPRHLFKSLEGDAALRFAGCTRDTSFVFTSRPSTPCASDLHVSIPIESNVSYTSFKAQLKHQILACDHIVPIERVDQALGLALSLLEEQQRRLVSALSHHFPYPRECIYWVQSHRMCEISVRETKQSTQWGLAITLQGTSRLQVRNDSESLQTSHSSAIDRELSARTRCRVFLPKSRYSAAFTQEAAFQSFLAIELAVSKPEKHKAKGHEAIRENQHTNALKATELPEMLTVSSWGSHDDDPVLDHPSTAQVVTSTTTFQPVDIKTPFPRNRIVQAACSRFHTLFLSDTGLMYAYGHSMDGALGLGSNVGGYVAQPTLVDYFLDHLIIVQSIACGGDKLVGAHSAAVSQEGRLYAWGVGIALGRGTLRSAATPQQVALPPVEEQAEIAVPVTRPARSVSCGSGFCVALTREGHAFSWGKWSNGRLGLGRIPIIARTSRRHGGGSVRKQFQSFQLSPRRIDSLYTVHEHTGAVEKPLFSKVACGDAHCVGLTTTGGLVTWGRGSSGQQGRGDVKDTLAPTLVFQPSGHQQWRDVVAGEDWSMALASNGHVWSWGAYGGAVLGHGVHNSDTNALLAETVLQRHHRLLSQRRFSTTASASLLRLPQLKWMTPQVIPCFATPDIHIVKLSAGAQHAAAISTTGDLYMWGTKNDVNGGDATGLVLSSLPKLVNSGQMMQTEGKLPNPLDIGTFSVEDVVCGGHQTIALTSSTFLARSLSQLYRDTLAQEPSIDRANPTYADLVLIVSDQRLLAHKLLLAHRSPVLRALILEEEQQHRKRLKASDGDTLMELLLPTLRVDVARRVLEFIYTDDFTIEASETSYYLIHDVTRAAKLFQLSSLSLLCRKRLLSASPSSFLETSDLLPDESHANEPSAANSEDEGESRNAEPPRTLNDDMKCALWDENWADTILVAEGRSIPVHRCMLVARSEYFRAVLAFRRSSAQAAATRPIETNTIRVHVEDSYAGLVRVLRFIYYDQVALPHLYGAPSGDVKDGDLNQDERDGEDDQTDHLFEDLIAADKYGLDRMKRLCEHALRVNAVNCLEVLVVANLIHAAHLKHVAMRVVQTHLADVTRRRDFQRFQQAFPHLLEELYANLRDASRDDFRLRQWHTEVATTVAAQREETKGHWGTPSTRATFPWGSLCFAGAMGTLYLSVMHAQEHEYSFVPATNLVALAALGGAIVLGYL